mgnify:CR=1 FL=1
MLVLAMQFSRSVGAGPRAQHPGHEDAGAATRWPCRRRLEELAGATPSKQKTGQCVEPELDHREGRTLADGRRRPVTACRGARVMRRASAIDATSRTDNGHRLPPRVS